MFADRESWLRHEIETHRVEWFCSFCSHSVCNSRADLESHMQSKHGDRFQDNQLSALLDASKRASDRIAVDSCPFCFKYGKKQKSMNAHLNTDKLFIDVKDFRHFYSHVGKHMEQLALFALPTIDGLQEGDFESEEAHSGAGTNSRSTRFDFTDSSSSNDGKDLSTEFSSAKEDPPLHLAAFNGRVGEVKARLRKGEDPNTTGPTWGSTLGAAVANNQAKIVKLLIRNGARGDMPSMGYCTIVHASFETDRKKTIQRMLFAAFVTNKGSNYMTALRADIKSRIELLQPLVALLETDLMIPLETALGSYFSSELTEILDKLVHTHELIDPNSDAQYYNLMGKTHVFLSSLGRTCVLINLMFSLLGVSVDSIPSLYADYSATERKIKLKMRVVNERDADLSLSRLLEEYRYLAGCLCYCTTRLVSISR